jgi:cholesterol transport system auxiliary component
MRPISALLALMLTAGCVSTANLPALQYYVLRDAGPPSQARPASLIGRVLLVQPTSVNAFYDTQRLVYSRADGQRAYYQFAAWTERPGRAFSDLLSRRLGAPSATAGVRGDLVLRTRLEELYHDASVKPGAVRIEVSAELVDAAGRQVGERRRFTRSVPTDEENAAAAVDAANRAVTEVLDDIAAWLDGHAASSVARS